MVNDQFVTFRLLQVTIARVYNWDVHQRRIQLAATSVEDS